MSAPLIARKVAMKHRMTIVVLVLGSFAAALPFATRLARADGLFYKLPKDGTWAVYQLDGSFCDKDKPADSLPLKGAIRMASVGQVTENGQLCRWIEVTFDLDPPFGGSNPRWKDVWKVLVPEKYLAKGETPMDHVIRAWQRSSLGKNAEKVKDPTTLRQSLLGFFISGPMKEAKSLPKAEVESKLGKLQCDGVTAGAEPKEGSASIEIRLHPDAPFGVVACRLNLELVFSARPTGTILVRCNLNLSDFGDKAKAEIPNTDE
jgi:hypothetical protein